MCERNGSYSISSKHGEPEIAVYREVTMISDGRMGEGSKTISSGSKSIPLTDMGNPSHGTDMNELAHDGSDIYTSYTDLIMPAISARKIPKCISDNKFLWLWICILATCLTVNWVTMAAVLRRLQEETMESLVLRERSSISWTQPRVSAFLSLYQFECNYENGNISETGPYVYRYITEKENITWHQNFSVSYRERQTVIFEESLSVGPAPRIIPFQSFIMNDTEPVMTVYTGESNFSQLNQVFSWNYSLKLPFWNSEEASRIRGTDGSIFSPFLNEKSRVILFDPGLLRTFDLEFTGTGSFKDLPVYRFIIPDSQFSNSTAQTFTGSSTDLEPREGEGYCAMKCVPSGQYNFDPEAKNDMWYVSLPHFLGADPYYRQLVTGLQPDESKHRPTFDIDRITGMTVSQKRRFQINMYGKLSNRSEAYIPAFWLELSTEVTDDCLRDIMRKGLPFKMTYGICISVGVLLCISLLVLLSLLTCQIMTTYTRLSKYLPLTFSNRGHCC